MIHIQFNSFSHPAVTNQLQSTGTLVPYFSVTTSPAYIFLPPALILRPQSSQLCLFTETPCYSQCTLRRHKIFLVKAAPLFPAQQSENHFPPSSDHSSPSVIFEEAVKEAVEEAFLLYFFFSSPSCPPPPPPPPPPA